MILHIKSDCCFNFTLKQSDTKAPEFVIVVLRMAFTTVFFKRTWRPWSVRTKLHELDVQMDWVSSQVKHCWFYCRGECSIGIIILDSILWIRGTVKKKKKTDINKSMYWSKAFALLRCDVLCMNSSTEIHQMAPFTKKTLCWEFKHTALG